MVTAIALYAHHKVLGSSRQPATEQEAEDLSGEVDRLMNQCGFLTYKPHLKQEMMHRSRSLRKLMMGGNQIGKTTSGLVDDLAWALGFWPNGADALHPVSGDRVRRNARILIAAQDFLTSHAEVIIPKLRELIPLEVFVKRIEKIQGRIVHRLEFWNGASFKLASYQSDPMSWEGPTWDKVHFDEPPPEFAYTGSKRGCQKHRAPILFTMTPLSEPWIFDKLHEAENAVHCNTLEDALATRPEDVFVTTVDISENPHISQEAKDDFLRGLDPEEREAREKGRFMHLMGRIYKSFDRATHVLDDDRWKTVVGESEWQHWPSGVVIDPHDEKPFAIAWFVVTPRNEIIWIHEWPDFDFYSVKGWGWGVPEYRAMIHETEKALGLTNVQWRIMDPNFGKTKSANTGLTLQEEFEEEKFDDDGETIPPYYFDCTVDNDIPSGHLLVREWLNRPAMFWRSHLSNCIRGMTHYIWSQAKGKAAEKGPMERPHPKFKDFPDLFRYCVKSGVEYFDAGDLVPQIDWDGIHNLGMG